MKIEKGIPKPILSKYPSPEEMKIGDSFLVESSEEKHRMSALGAMIVKSKRRGLFHKYSTRKVENGFRIWRVK